jgi:hypothetical protein
VEDYASNSKKNKEEPKEPVKKVTRVVTGKVVERKPSIGKKIKGIFFAGEFKAAGQYIASEVLLPAFRDLIVDSFTKGVDRVVYGEPTYRPQRGRTEYRNRVTYNNPMNPRVYETTARERGHVPDQPSRPRSYRGGLEYIVQSRAEAEDAMEMLLAALEKFDFVTIADVRECLGLPPNKNYTDTKWGWTVLNDVEIRQIREGYLLDLPPAEAL